MIIARFNTIDLGTSVPLRNFNETILVAVRVPKGKYVVFGKVSISNADGDSQNAGARLTSKDGLNTIDRADVRLNGGGTQSVSVQGTLPVDSETEIVDLRGTTFNGAASGATLIVISVDDLIRSPP